MSALDEALLIGAIIAGCLLIACALAVWASSRHRWKK
jgi:hypothetical protein